MRTKTRCAPPAFAEQIVGVFLTDKPAAPTTAENHASKLKRAPQKKVIVGKGANGTEKMRVCGNCLRMGHQAVTCDQPCFACGGGTTGTCSATILNCISWPRERLPPQKKAADACGIVHCFGLAKDVETTSSDTGLSRRTVGLLLDRLRLASALVAEFQRETLVFEDCQVEADETVIRKERVYETLPNGEK